MDELLRHATITIRSMWRYRWIGLAVAWSVAAIGFTTILFIPDRYEASARIYVNTASILKPLMTGLTVQPNDDQRIAGLSHILITRPNVEKLVQTVGLDANSKSSEEYDRLIDRITKTLEIKTAGKDIYSLSYRDEVPERAKQTVQQFTSMFIESGKGGKIDETDTAKKFIDEQIAVYEKKLQDAENRLKDFKLRYLGMAPGEGAGYFARLSETSALLTRAQLELREAENSRDAFKRGLASEDPYLSPSSSSTTPATTNADVSDIEARLDAMRRNLDVLLQKYTDSHPDVVGAKRVIKELEEQRRQLIASRPKSFTPQITSNGGGIRASEQLKVSLASAEAAVASLRIRVSEYTARYNQLKAAATLMPQLESEFAQLNRDYDVNKKNYESLVSRRESASISGDMQIVSGVADFRLIDPPRVSPQPVAPNRKLLLPIALLIALLSGIGAAFVAKELRPTFYDKRSLSAATGLPVLGSVSLVMTASQRHNNRRDTIQFIGGVGALLVTYLAGFIALTILSARTI